MKKLLLLALVLSTPVSAHSWYSSACCSNSDCHPVPCEELSEEYEGSAISWKTYKFSKEQVHPSQDNKCHVCIHNYVGPTGTDPRPLCVYVQQGS